ncbi:esterase-like activity of phytase family protein [Rhodobacter sp. SGA-6-6]|uniref:esterase-like activity of phytase family protein n=1 Tax=Rhodobacter sp. SGA-6-6 TaxID=2710882 RepID=UPI0013EE27AC|nr:esterase-like activity of phytase family protein [Rhodobacter sp. SGA-6-6]NGM44267.1 esterase-like activity of phytase family protein [Rhodobacter sp. SGA-6-6]
MPRRSRLGLIAAALVSIGLSAGAASGDPAEFLSAFRWTGEDARLGGLSAIDLSPDGSRFVVLSDRGAMAEGRFLRDGEGAITGIEVPPLTLLEDGDGAPLRPGRSDSEGIARAPDGTIYISFEGAARVLAYDRIGGPARSLPRPEAFRRMQANSALEALAIDNRGRLFTLPERSGAEDRPFPVHVFDGRAWSQPFSIPRDGPFLPVGADFGPDGRLYLLERDFHGLGGFANRVRAFTLGPDGPLDVEVVLQTRLGSRDNLEGIAVWRDDRGRIRLTMVSDDNFRFFLRQQVVEYVLPVDGRPVGG